MKKGERKPTEVAAVAADRKLFAFTCTSNYTDIMQGLNLPTTKLRGGIIDTGASLHFCLDQTKCWNYCPLKGQSIHTADGRSHIAARVGDVIIELPNRDKRGKVMLKEAIHAPGFTFTLMNPSCVYTYPLTSHSFSHSLIELSSSPMVVLSQN